MRFHPRKQPARGVIHLLGRPTIVFLTVRLASSKQRLDDERIHECLRRTWLEEATSWTVGDYVLMPDHLHLFCSPATYPAGCSVERWIEFWKSRASKSIGWGQGVWQTLGFHHRIRGPSEYQEKSEYLRFNPVRDGLATTYDEWPFKGRIEKIEWPY